jgi:F0F1-type ATP synthase membrane subunit c/vacuolar-type H+-ATPase subunit K
MWAAVYEWFDHWQTLIAGLLALLAGVGTVWGTLIAANRQVKAAQRQTEAMRDQERLRITWEGYAFHAMLERFPAG